MRPLVKTVIVLLILVIGVGGAAAWYLRRSDQNGAAYRTAPVKRTNLVSTISATGTVVPEEVVDVGAQVNGPIASFGNDKEGKPVDYGSEIDQGMILARIDDSIYSADVATSEAQVAQARSQIRSAEANRAQALARLEQTKRDWERVQQLAQSPALARSEYDAAQSEYEQAQAAIGVAEASIGQGQAAMAMAEASLRRATRNLAFCTIASPVEGVIIDKRVEIGQTVVASLNAPSLFLIAKDLRRMQVLVQVNEADVGSVRPGQPITFTADAFPGRAFKGQVRKVRLNATMTQNVVTYTVEIVTDNADLLLLPYLTANVRFEIARRDNVLAVPNAALRWTPREQAAPAGAETPEPAGGRERAGTLWVLEEGRLRGLSVKAGLSDGAFTQVEGEGLSEGLTVVIGEQTEAESAAPTGTTNPFAPPMRRGGGGGGGGGGGRR